MLIGLAGKRGVGKSTAAGIIEKEFGFIQAALSTPFKEGLANMFGWDISSMSQPGIKDEITEFGFSRRDVMQFTAEAFRENYGKDIWNRIFKHNYKDELDKNYNITIQDIRHDDQAQFVRDEGGVIIHIMSYERVKNEDPVIDTHVSEQGITHDPLYDYIITNDDSIQAFANRVVAVVNNVLSQKAHVNS